MNQGTSQIKVWVIFSILFVSFLLPSFIFVVLNSSSLWLGVLIASVINMIVLLLFLGPKVFFNKKDVVFFLVPFLIVVLNIVFVSKMEKKSLFSLVWFFCFFVSMQFGKVLGQQNDRNILSAIVMMLFVLFFLGWTQIIFSHKIGEYSAFLKSVFPFSEESHFSLAVGMFYMPTIVLSKKLKMMVFSSLNVFFMAVLFPSLTMLVFFIMGMMILLFKIEKRFFILLAPVLFLFILICVSGIAFFPKSYLVMYFGERLNFHNATNITTLVFIQGWEFAYNNFINTNGVGLGFQMLGEETTYLSNVTFLIREMTNGYSLNLYDGGFLCSKVISEFGMLGLILSVSYAVFVIDKIILFALTLNKVNKNPRLFIIYSILVAFSVEYFLRGYGYFSPGVLLVISSVYALCFYKFEGKNEK